MEQDAATAGRDRSREDLAGWVELDPPLLARFLATIAALEARAQAMRAGEGRRGE